MSLVGHIFEIRSGDQHAMIAEIGAQLAGYRVADRDITPVHDPNALAPKSSGAVLMPWPNRIRGGRYRWAGADQQLAVTEPALGNAIHGLAAWARWAAVEHGEDHVTMECAVVPQRGFAHVLRARVEYRLSQAGLTVTLGARNEGDDDFPFGAGCHPYLRTGDVALPDVELQLPAGQFYEVDEAQIPTGTRAVEGTDFDFRVRRTIGATKLDTAFTGLSQNDAANDRGAATVKAGAHTTTLWWDAGVFTTLQVFTPPADLPGGPALAIEPMTCPADAYNSGIDLMTLKPGEEWTGQWGITPA